MVTRRVGCAVCVVLWCLASPASAQYFGRNKVQYRSFHFAVLRSEHFDIYHYAEEVEGARMVARMAERWHLRLSQVFGGELRGRQPIVLYASQPDFRQTNVLAGQIGEGTGGVTESVRRRIVMPLGGSIAATDHVVGHELVHAFQFDVTTKVEADNARRQAGAERLPLWFIEGMAEYLSRGPADATTAMWLRDALSREQLPSLRRLNDPRYFPYRWGHAVWAYLGGSFGDWVVPELLRTAASSGDVNSAFETVLNLTEREVSTAWHRSIRLAYGALLAELQEPTAYGTRLTAEGRDIIYEVGPALSPDGTKVAFLSERDLLSMHLYVATTDGRQPPRRISSSTTVSHETSLQFIASAGAWDREGRRLAFTATRRGRAWLLVYDDEQRRVVHRYTLPDVDEAATPTWAPDGKTIAFSGSKAESTDLFLLTIDDGRVEQLTRDVFADLQPAWSPDGLRIAFTTDRRTTQLATLAAGSLQLAMFDLTARTVIDVPLSRPLPARTPQWESKDTIWFVSDETGIANVYRLSLADGMAVRTTHFRGGIEGITETSPALSVSQSGHFAFSSYEEGRHRVFVGSLPRPDAGPVPSVPPLRDVVTLPGGQSSTLLATLSDATTGLPPSGAGELRPYHPRLGLDFFAQPSVGVAVGRYGTSVGGGLMLGMSDMLGDHNAVAAFDTAIAVDRTFSASDLGLYGAYQNLRRRWNWGIAAEQLPYRTGKFAVGTAPSSAGPVLIEEETLYRQVSRGLSATAAYPLDEGQRIELGAGFRHYDFEQVRWTTTTSLTTGRHLTDTETRLVQPGISLSHATMAFVRDRALFGATSPVSGDRARVEWTPTTGTIGYTGLLIDYRRYFMPVSFYTLAARVLHYGRYGSGSDDPRLLPVFLGYPEFVRGYDAGSWTVADCDAAGRCELWERLQGSRMLVTNLELRFPLFRPLGLDRRLYGPIPTEVAFFTDAGVAWSRGHAPAWLGGSRSGVRSAGVTLRVNMFGFAIGQLSLVRPFDRPQRGWDWQFSLTPGY